MVLEERHFTDACSIAHDVWCLHWLDQLCCRWKLLFWAYFSCLYSISNTSYSKRYCFMDNNTHRITHWFLVTGLSRFKWRVWGYWNAVRDLYPNHLDFNWTNPIHCVCSFQILLHVFSLWLDPCIDAQFADIYLVAWRFTVDNHLIYAGSIEFRNASFFKGR